MLVDWENSTTESVSLDAEEAAALPGEVVERATAQGPPEPRKGAGRRHPCRLSSALRHAVRVSAWTSKTDQVDRVIATRVR